ncbi:MAG: 30S ribosomal protein S17 [Planctomycetes bacterium]|nr:30S ribosomal protein S17 [Planctomycetota bacterium]
MQDKKIKTITAEVVSKTGDKSIKVAINYKIKHPRYGKYVRRKTTLGVHDEHNKANVGDLVEISECRPISKSKNWRLVGVVSSLTQD